LVAQLAQTGQVAFDRQYCAHVARYRLQDDPGNVAAVPLKECFDSRQVVEGCG
jgi:hypothetical protein